MSNWMQIVEMVRNYDEEQEKCKVSKRSFEDVFPDEEYEDDYYEYEDPVEDEEVDDGRYEPLFRLHYPELHDPVPVYTSEEEREMAELNKRLEYVLAPPESYVDEYDEDKEDNDDYPEDDADLTDLHPRSKQYGYY